MGRLRNLSASFKAAAFPSANNASNSYNKKDISEVPGEAQEKKDMPPVVRETSSHSVLQKNSSRPTSIIYTPPTIMPAANEDVEELRPVFRYAGHVSSC